MYITMYFLSTLIFLGGLGMCFPFRNFFKFPLLPTNKLKLFALRKPKKFEEMDDFDKFEKYSREGNDYMREIYLQEIYTHLKNETQDYIPVTDMSELHLLHYVEHEIYQRLETDTFEEYLRNEFHNIPKKIRSFLHFEEFYEWRKKTGLVLTKDEVRDYFEMVVGEFLYCDMIQFIAINYLIDESDAPLS